MQYPTLHRASADNTKRILESQRWLAVTAACCAMALLTAFVSVLQQAVETGQARQAIFLTQSVSVAAESN